MVAGVTRHPDQEWMEQMARNVTMEDSGFLINRRYLLHDGDSKYCSLFRQVIEAGSVKTTGKGAVSRAAGRSAEVLRAQGRVGVEVGTAGHVWLSHISHVYIRMRAAWPKQRAYRA